MVSRTNAEIASRLNLIFTPFTGVNITLNMIIHKKKEADTENFRFHFTVLVDEFIEQKMTHRKKIVVYIDPNVNDADVLQL